MSRYIEEYRSLGSTAAPGERDRRIVEHMALVRQIARRLGHSLPPEVDQDDLVQAGCLGLIAAVDRFDEAKGVLFRTYAEHRIRGAILDWLREIDWAPRSLRQLGQKIQAVRQQLAGEQDAVVPVADADVARHLGMTVEELARTERQIEAARLVSLNETVHLSDEERIEIIDLLDSGDTGRAIENAELQEFRRRLGGAVAALPERLHQALSLYYVEGLTMKEAADVLGVTESRVSQMCTDALRRVRRTFAEQGVGGSSLVLSDALPGIGRTGAERRPERRDEAPGDAHGRGGRRARRRARPPTPGEDDEPELVDERERPGGTLDVVA